MFEQSQLLDKDDCENSVSYELPLESLQRRAQKIESNFKRTVLVILALVLSNLLTAIVSSGFLARENYAQRNFHTSSSIQPHNVKWNITDDYSFPIVDELPASIGQFKWWTPWGLEDGARRDTGLPSVHVADELWDGVPPSHGLVAVDRTWAKDRNWPDSMYLPKDPNGKEKGVYLLEAYHLIHCLKIIRLSFIEAHRQQNLTWPVGHVTHCFDAMRQSIQCNADNTPLYTFGDMTAGEGQLRKCKSWDALRDWATEYSACYRDSVGTIPLRDHFGFCEEGRPYHDGKDGLP